VIVLYILAAVGVLFVVLFFYANVVEPIFWYVIVPIFQFIVTVIGMIVQLIFGGGGDDHDHHDHYSPGYGG
jgi:hypothetical protein